MTEEKKENPPAGGKVPERDAGYRGEGSGRGTFQKFRAERGRESGPRPGPRGAGDSER